MQRLPGNGGGVVTGAFQLDVYPDHGGQQTQMTRARQVQGNEFMTQAVDFPHGAVDRMVCKNGGGCEFVVAGLQCVHGVLDGRFHQGGHV